MTKLHMAPFFGALQDIIRADESAPAMIRCTHCGGSGETHSAYRDSTCGACDGRGKRPSNWRELMHEGEEG